MDTKRHRDFYDQLMVSERTKQNYRTSINSAFVKEVLRSYFDTDNLFAITDLKQLWVVYSYINLHPINIASHRAYSTAIMKYMRFLNKGEKYGKRIDYKKPRLKKNETSNNR